MFGCTSKIDKQLNANSWRKLDLHVFEMWIPPGWNYQQQQSRDSFAAEIVGPNKAMLSFDFSNMGYANHLIPTTEEYLNGRDWINEQIEPKAIKKIHKSKSVESNQFPKADFIAEFTYNGATTVVPIVIPAEIKNHNFTVDTTAKYIIKTMWPKVAGSGETGVYYQSRSSDLNFQMSASNLSKKDQELVLQAFKTIVIK
jgi:hypothetical protein